jgi:superfamily II DNA/RNA helicase
MVPAFKECVEVLFQRGLLKVVVATETLALGINMPARTVVLERLEKWNGESHVLLTPGEYTQLTGRAGRRGIDRVGHAVVLYQRDLDFRTVASLVGTRTYPLRSSFEPSYNMAVNLLRRHDLREAEALLGASFAQFEADQRVASKSQRLAELEEGLAGYARHLECEYGDWAAYWALRREVSRREKAEARARKDAVEQATACWHRRTGTRRRPPPALGRQARPRRGRRGAPDPQGHAHRPDRDRRAGADQGRPPRARPGARAGRADPPARQRQPAPAGLPQGHRQPPARARPALGGTRGGRTGGHGSRH